MIVHITTFGETDLLSNGSVPANSTDVALINLRCVPSQPGCPFWLSGDYVDCITIVNAAGMPGAAKGSSPPEIVLACLLGKPLRFRAVSVKHDPVTLFDFWRRGPIRLRAALLTAAVAIELCASA